MTYMSKFVITRHTKNGPLCLCSDGWYHVTEAITEEVALKFDYIPDAAQRAARTGYECHIEQVVPSESELIWDLWPMLSLIPSKNSQIGNKNKVLAVAGRMKRLAEELDSLREKLLETPGN